MEKTEMQKMFKDALKNELSPLLIGIRNDFDLLASTLKENHMQHGLGISLSADAVKEMKHHDGKTPVKGTDYFTDQEIAEFTKAATPIRGKDYFTNKDIESFKTAVTPVKGVDYFDGEKGYTPVKGTDYFTDDEVSAFLKKVTPVKGRDYFDGAPGEKGRNGTEISAEEIRNKLETLTGAQRLSAKAIKGLSEAIQERIKNFQTPKSQGGGIGAGSEAGGGGTTYLQQGTNVTITGTGTSSDPYIINSTGGSGSPAGSDTQIQFNNGGAFAGAAGITYNSTTQVTSFTAADLTGSATTRGFLFSQTYNTSGIAEGATFAYTNTASANTSRWLRITVGGSEVFSIGRVSFSAGVLRLNNALVLSNSGGQTIVHGGGSGTAFYDSTGGVVWGSIASTGMTLVPAQLTGAATTSGFSLTQTWNTSGAPAAILVNVTNTASSGNASLLTLQENSQNRFRFLPITATLLLGSGGNATGIGAANVASGAGLSTGTALRYLGTSSSTAGYEHWFIQGGTRTATSGESGNMRLTGSFAPTSGTGTYNHLSLTPTINQTGGASGITSALNINPVLTAAADWRSIWLQNNSGHAIYQSGASALNYFLGNTGMGTAATTTAELSLGAATTAVASLNIASGVAPTTPVNGDLWNDGTNLYMQLGGASYKVTKNIGILAFACQSSTPLASTTYYFGFPFDVSMVNTTAQRRQKVVPMTGFIRGAGITVIATAGGTTEQMQVIARINNTTDLVLSSVVQGDQVLQTYSVTGLSQAITSGDKIEIKVVTPAWVTAPTTVRIAVDLYIE